MGQSVVSKSETRKQRGLKRIQLPNYFKKIGWGIAILSFLSLMVNKLSIESLEYKMVARYGLLLGVFIVSMARDKIEDEFIVSLRMRSYSLAFVAGIVYAFVLPLIDYAIDFVRFGDGVEFKQAGDFMILWILMTIQVFYFEYLKKVNGC